MKKLLVEIEDLISHHAAKNEKVSKASVGWHLHHMLLTINQICKALDSSDPAQYKPNKNLSRTVIFKLNRIPRGKAQSPKQVRPPENIEFEGITDQLNSAKHNLENIEAMDRHVHFNHPYFGILHKAHTFKFLELHTKHHLKIIQDIINS